MRTPVVILIAFFTLLTLRGNAHGVITDVKISGSAVIVTSTYSPSEPLVDAVVTLYSPANPQEIWQNGRTDKNGRFAFIPETAGDWIFSVDDQKGHRGKITIPVPDEIVNQADAGTQDAVSGEEISEPGVGQVYKVIIGLSLIFGLTGIYYGIKSGKKG